MHTKFLAPAFLLASLLSASTRADLLVQSGHPGYDNPTINRFSDNGTFLATFHTDLVDETIDELLAAPDGTVYFVANNLGYGRITRIAPDGTVTRGAAVAGPIGIPIGLALQDDFLYVGSTAFNVGNLSGVLAFNPDTLAFVRNAHPLTLPAGDFATLNDLEVGPDGKLYVASNNTTRRYTHLANGTLVPDFTFFIPAAGDIEFRPGDSSVYLSSGTTISRYLSDGTLDGTLFTTSTYIRSYTFSADNLFVATTIVASNDATLTRYNAATGAFDATLATGGFYLMDYTAPEPASLLLSLPAAALLLKRRR